VRVITTGPVALHLETLMGVAQAFIATSEGGQEGEGVRRWQARFNGGAVAICWALSSRHQCCHRRTSPPAEREQRAREQRKDTVTRTHGPWDGRAREHELSAVSNGRRG
jgi:hypothetical protein